MTDQGQNQQPPSTPTDQELMAIRDLGDDATLTPAQVGKVIHVSPFTLQQWRRSGHGPRYLSLSRTRVVYRVAAVREWLRSRERSSTSDSGETSA